MAGGRRMFVLGGGLALAGCGGPPPQYSDPLAELHNLPGSSAPLDTPAKAGPTIAIVFGSNIEKLLQYSDAAAKGLMSMPIVNRAALKDGDAQYLVTGAVQTIKQRYPSVESVDDLATAARRKFSTSIVVDIVQILGAMTGQKTTAHVTAIFFDAQQSPISRLESSGTTTVGYPAVTSRFREASDIALADFGSKVNRYWS
jgi:hypothetical protein